jgi:hypothetical protein
MALGSTQPLTEMSTTNLPRGKGQPAHKAHNFTVICEQTVYKIGALTSRNSMGLHGLLQAYETLKIHCHVSNAYQKSLFLRNKTQSANLRMWWRQILFHK